MLLDDFKAKYSSIPLATFSRSHKAGDTASDTDTLTHMHREVELLAVEGGRALFYIDTVRYEVTAGDLVLVSPFCLHRTTILAQEDFRHICLCFDLSLLPAFPLKEELESGRLSLPPVLSGAKEYIPHVQAAYYANRDRRPGWEMEAIGHLSLLFSGLLAEEYITAQKKESIPNFAHGIQKYMDEHYEKPLTSAEMAVHFHITPAYFCRLFRQNFGYTFLEYLCAYRLDRSKILLRETDLSVSEIALRVGFNSFSYYSKKFKERNRISPREWRQTYR